MRGSRIAPILCATCAAVLVSVAPAFAADSSQDFPKRVKVPETARDHEALAKVYEADAAKWRGVAKYHREMASAYEKSNADPADAKTMQDHCAKFTADAETLAGDAETMAKYHRLRAKEAQKK